MVVTTHIRPHVGARYRVTDSRHRIFEGTVRSANGELIVLEVSAGKDHYWKSVEEKTGDLITVELSRCTFDRL